MARARSTNLHTAQTWVARMVLLGAALTVAAGVTSAVWADQAPPADARKADIATQLDQANAAQRANAPKPAGGDAVAAKAADRAARAARPPAGASSLNWDRGVADTRRHRSPRVSSTSPASGTRPSATCTTASMPAPRPTTPVRD